MEKGTMLKKSSKNSSLASIHEKIVDSLRDHKIGELTDRLYAEEYRLYKDGYRDDQYRIGSETESMNSISSTDDTFQWGGPQDDSLRYGDESHGLMDSCLQELENRGTMNFGEDNMNYMPEDQYGGPGHGPYSGEYNSYNGGPHHDTSLHSSHVSLQSTGSNRNRAQMKLSNQNLGSQRSIPQDQYNHDNYAPYSSLQRNDYQGSPIPSNGSPRGPGTPTRFNNNYDDYQDSYRNSPLAYPANHSQGYGEPDSYDENPMQQQYFHHPESANHNDSFRGAPDDRYGGPPEDSFYRQSPMLDNRYGGGPPPDDPRDNYMDSPRGGYRGDDSFQGHPDNSFQGQPHYSSQPQLVDRYGQPVENGYPAGMMPQEEVPHPEDRYGENMDDSYRGPHEDNYRGQPDDSYRGPQDDSYRGPQDDSFRGPVPQDDRSIPTLYRDMNDDGYRGDNYDDHPQDPRGNGYHDNMPRDYTDDSYQQEPDRRHEGLPQVQDDPFADDPFRQKQRSLLQLQGEDPYPRGPSPGAGSDRMGPGSYTERPPQYDHMDGQEPPGRYFDDSMGPPMGSQQHIDGYPDDGRRTPSTTGGTMRWRAPDLQEVIDFLSHPSDMVKANAAGYITHLSYMDDGIKQKVRGLDGIPLLVELLNSEFPEVHKNACGALKNLSYGRNNDENKKAIKNAGGIPALVRLLRKTQDEDVKDSVTGVLWNLSSNDDLKRPIVDDGLAVLVNVVIIPHSGWERRGLSPFQAQEPWTTVFRNATGVLRNVSSAGAEARKKLRECHGLVESLIHTLRTAIDQSNVDNKPIENCVCTLRNLSFRIQEVEDPDFFRKRTATLKRQKQQAKGEKTGCFGGGGKKKGPKGKGGQNVDSMEMPKLPPSSNEYRGLWGVDAVRYFLTLLSGSNPVTLEAACGAIQNLAACDWKPAIEIRALVRKEKGLPSLVDLLTYEVERVVGASATALRNLSIDERNKELVGKYAMKQLISNLPQENRPKELTDETVCAVLACLNEVISHNQEFAKSFCIDGGLPRLMYLTRVHEIYNARTKKYAASVCQALWEVKVLHKTYMEQGYTEKDFKPSVPVSSGVGQPNSNFSTPYNTINRPKYSQGYDDTTLASRRGNGYTGSPGTMGSNPRLVQGHSNPALDQHDAAMYGSQQGRLDAVPMNDIGPGYAPIDEQRNPRNKPPAGAVPLFPNMMPGQQQGSPTQEPLYARVNKKRPVSPGQVMLGQDQAEGADSWV
ncbi:splicing regulator ARVCF-like isoform X4 [Mercenaria mercenaria]|uniref:splicing regulator ARVCF-like isoform X4 n=1 Tax=Mercenaria mercenaria TaxID=6596 RepID=UPI00234F920C|nr:splicing regulator ARVCF-like isoform X4 [Mercenaria mercenaria]